MKRFLLTLILATAGAIHLSAQTSAFNGFCESGGRSAVIQGLSSTNKLNGVIPSCTVSVYMTGTTTLATIYKDSISTPLANPFTANNLVAAGPGQWLFYALTGPGYDVVMSGGIPPNVYLQPVTLTDLQAGGGGGGGGPSILTNNVPNTSQSILNFINPAAFNGLSFAFSNPSGGIETFGVTGTLNNAGITNPQTTVNGQVCVLGSTCTITTTGTIVQVNGVNITTQSPVNFENSASVAFTNPSAGIIQASVDVTQGIGQFIQPPISGQFVILTPTGFSKTDAPAVTVSGDLTSADMASGSYCSFGSSGTATWTFTGALEAQYPTLNPSNITAVYSAAVGSNHGILPVPTGCLSTSTYNVAAFSLTSSATGASGGSLFSTTSEEFESVPATSQLVSLTGANVDTTQVHGTINLSGDFRGATDTTVTGVRLFVYYTGSPVSSPGFIPVNVPLLYSFTNGLSIDPNAAFWGTGLQARRIVELPPATSWPNTIIAVTDGVSNADCTTGGGSTPLQCRSTGTIWTAYGGGGGGGGSVGTAGQMQMVGSTSGSFAPSACTDDGSTITCTEPIQTVGPPFGIAIDAGTAVAGASGTVVYASDATSGFAEVNENNTGLSRVCTAANGICAAGGGTGIISRVSCVTYGCVADGNLGANTGTDNTSFFAACHTAAVAAKGVCYIPAGVYRIATSMPTISEGGTGFVGDVQGFTASTEWVQPSTTIFSSSASATILTIDGGAGYIFGDVLQNIGLQRSVTPNTGSIGLLMNKANTATIKGNVFADSSIGADITDSPSAAAPVASVSGNGALWCYSGVSAGAGPNIGFNLHGGGAGFISLIVDSNVVGNNCGSSPTSYGYKIDGNIVDLNLSGNFTAGTSYGVYMTGTGGQDVQILESTFDRCKVDCVYSSVVGSTVEIRGGWMTLADSGQTAGVELDTAAGTSIKDVTFFANQAVPAIYAHGLQDGTNAILNNRFYLNNTGSQAISANNATALNIVGNSIVGAGLTFTNPVIKFVNQSFGNITSNWLGNGAGTGISFDASSNSNCCSNLNTLITYTVSDAGTGNSFGGGGSGISGATTGEALIAGSATTATSSKPLAGAGAGLTTGPTSSTTADHFATMNGTDGRIKDSGVLITAIPAADIASGALANGMTATTQSAADNSTKVATTAYVDAHLVAAGTSAMGTSAISSGTCASVVTTAATGTATTDVIVYTPNADPTGVTGYAVSATGSLYIWAYPTSGNVNFKVCNNTSGSLTPSALTLNWVVRR